MFLHRVHASQPFTHVLCNDQNEPMEGKMTRAQSTFLTYLPHDPWGIFNSGNLTYPNITRSELMNKPQNISQWRVTLSIQSEAIISNITIGAILLKPLPSPGPPTSLLHMLDQLELGYVQRVDLY